jgi:two-component system, NarL family, response regulator NreC
VIDDLRIVIADDHALFRQGLRSLIEQVPGMMVVGEAEDGLDLLRLLKQVPADIVLLDIAMPNLRGIEAIPRIKMVNSKAKILIVTMYDDKEFLYQAISAGADGYFLKKCVDRELFSAIKEVGQGRVYVSSLLSTEFGRDWESIRDGFHKSILSDREKEVLSLIAKGKSNKEVGGLLFISVHTVERHRANIMAKLGLHTMADLLLYAIEKKFA